MALKMQIIKTHKNSPPLFKKDSYDKIPITNKDKENK